MDNSMEVSQKIKNRTTIWSNNPASEYISKGNEVTIPESAFPYSLQHFSNNQNTETFKVFVRRWMSKENVIHICVSICVCTHSHTCTHTMEYYSTTKRKEFWHMLEQNEYEISQTQKVEITIWLHLHEIPRISKFRQKVDQRLSG